MVPKSGGRSLSLGVKRVENSDQSTKSGEESGEESDATDDENVDDVLPEVNPKSVPMEPVTQLKLPKVTTVELFEVLLSPQT